MVPQMGLVGDSDAPHESVIATTAKALITSHFHWDRTFCQAERESISDTVLVAF